MRPIRIILPMLLMMSTAMMAQNTYEYWIDGGYANHKTVSGSNANITLPLDGLTPGLHAFYYRVVAGDTWNNLYRSMFFIPQQSVGTSAPEQREYEYWIDGDYANHKTVNGNTGVTLSLEGLTSGLHAFYYRVVNDNGSWNNLSHALFFIPQQSVGTSAPEQREYEYWIDGDYANHKTVNGNAGVTLSLEGLTHGLHAFYYRVVNENGSWNNLSHTLFFIPQQKAEQNPEIAAYEYWIDDNWENRQTALDAKNLSQLTTSIKGLSEGEHQFVIRVKNTAGTWSGLYYIPFEIVYKPGDANGDDVVDVADVVAIVNYILGDIAENFKIRAANVDGEVNEDGTPNISVSDVVGVVNIILEAPATEDKE